MADAVALAEDQSFARDLWIKELAEEIEAPVFDGTRWTFPVSTKGEEQ